MSVRCFYYKYHCWNKILYLKKVALIRGKILSMYVYENRFLPKMFWTISIVLFLIPFPHYTKGIWYFEFKYKIKEKQHTQPHFFLQLQENPNEYGFWTYTDTSCGMRLYKCDCEIFVKISLFLSSFDSGNIYTVCRNTYVQQTSICSVWTSSLEGQGEESSAVARRAVSILYRVGAVIACDVCLIN